MQIQIRSNPKTTGWARVAAISLLAGLAAFVLSIPIAFFLFLSHFDTAYPKDTQNLLSALTASVLTGVSLATLTAATTLLIATLYKRLRPASAV
ncbi:hypothetical protein [Granulicella arctica]|uniref:hypothetical protein n=1 Tax=Granulicella arctica TaxID=940613 RepID=UPI0021DF813B|nr:hypothetical protein [Granulicella arctica]